MTPGVGTAFGFGAIILVIAGCGRAPDHRPSRPDPAAAGVVITQEDIERHPGESIERLLQRKVPGLVVRRTRNGGIALQLRGATSYDGSDTSPLYVMNDIPVEPGPDGSVPGLDPRNIASIRVLRGPETALYGIRGQHGVILIRTRAQ